MQNTSLKLRAIQLRRRGRTYTEIKRALGINIPKSTLSNWCNSVSLSQAQKDRILEAIQVNAERGRAKALLVNYKKRTVYLSSIERRVKHIPKLLHDKEISKLAATILYLGEGGKNRKGALMFGNSDPTIISLFLSLLRHSYKIDEGKFRCTLQCRADQNVEELERFWSRITRVPLGQFYRARIDPRTVGKPSRKLDYKGVCRIDYFSADLFNEISKLGELICKTGR